jgi:hypothetical protein
MSNEFTSDWWSIELEPGWFAHPEAECISFRSEGGVGAFQISSYRHEAETVPMTDLNAFMENEIPADVLPQKTKSGEFSGFGVDYIDEGKFWRKQWVTKGSVLVFVMYNCDAEDQTVEKTSVSKMLTSLKSRV